MPRFHPFRFDPEKALQVILYVANNAAIPDVIHVCKCLYFADKRQLEYSGRFICGDHYVAMANGPVPSETYDLIKDVQENRQSLWGDVARSTFELSGWTIVPLKPLDTAVFSTSELRHLDWAIENYGALPVKELIAETKKEKPYLEAAESDSKISVESIASALTDSELILGHLRDPDPEFKRA